MKDIQKAIEIDNLYIENRIKDITPFNLIDEIRKCGYKTLDEYEEDKRDYQFKNMDFEFLTQEPITGIVKSIKLFHEKKSFVLFAPSEITFVFNGEYGLKNFNENYCKQHGIPVVPIGTSGGTIVSTSDDFSLVICCPSDIYDKSIYILDKIKNIIQKHTNKIVSVDRNDILIDGNKVCGSAEYSLNDMFMFVAYFSFSDKTHLIENICKATKIGKPIGYIDFMNREFFKQEVVQWLQENSI